MNITYHDRTQLILEARLPLKVRVTMFCLSIVMSLAMVLIASNIVADVGTKRLSCSRTEASRIQPFRLLKAKSSLPKISKSLATCAVRESKYFGLVQSPPRTFEQVQEAQAQSSRNPDGGSITINDETIPILDHRLLFTISKARNLVYKKAAPRFAEAAFTFNIGLINRSSVGACDVFHGGGSWVLLRSCQMIDLGWKESDLRY